MRRPLAVTPELETDRLLLRRWRLADRFPFAELNADPQVMAYFPAMLSRAQSDALVEHIDAQFDRYGFGLWAVEIPDAVPFVGFVGLSIPQFTSHFTPCVEIGWRLAAHHWGHGYATEAALAVASFGFETLRLDEIVSFTVPANGRSRRVMERIGMTHNPADDFDHPSLPPDHPLSRHVLYRLRSGDVVRSER